MADTTESLNKKERKALGRQQKFVERQRISQKRKIKQILITVVIFAIVGGGIAALANYVKNQPKTLEGDVISKNGLHWHPKLTIVIKGEKKEIPANIGIGVVHDPLHTHDATGVIHMEMQGLITKDDTKLGQFFRVWGKQFNANCIFEFCNGSDGNMKMLVNGTENTEFENYLMKDGDKIEIRYE